ncbi:MAG: hypothetical protein ACRBF0_00535 [Calditrichia bacterium]
MMQRTSRNSKIRFVLALTVLLSTFTIAQHSNTPHIHAGSIELAAQGSFTYTSGNRDLSFGVRSNYFFSAGPQLLSFGLESAISNTRSFTRFDNRLLLGAYKDLPDSPIYLRLTATGGLRQEKLGSFWLSRYSMGLMPGLHVLVGNKAAFFAEYHLQRILDDPIQNFTEHRLQIGISLFLRNK